MALMYGFEKGWNGTVSISGKFVEDPFGLNLATYNYSVGSAQYNKAIQDLKPTRVIYNNPVTICFFSDGSKEISRCNPNEPFEPEYGVMACIMKKIFNSRSEFLKLVDSGYYQEEK